VNYCSQCGGPVSLRVPDGDNLPRYVCDRCGTVHYQNPKIVAGCVPEWDGRILLCRRAIEPRYGLWTLPAGFMENGETTVEAAAREAKEEANAQVDDLVLYGVFNLPHVNQVYLMFRGRLRDGRASAGAESLDVGLFDERDIPWAELAFPVVHETLQVFFAERRGGEYGVHMGDVVHGPDDQVRIQRHRITYHR
jgi:ADP-ribose pyrophosphatase YjhB (NUDIX family)